MPSMDCATILTPLDGTAGRFGSVDSQPDGDRAAGDREQTCDRCRGPVDDDAVGTVRGSTICVDCAAAYWQCEQCDGWNRDGDECGNGCCDPDFCDCESCRDGDVDDFGGLVHDYDYRPWPVFHGTGPLFLGCEIEVATPYGAEYDCAATADIHLGRLGYLKADSSIDNGFEIVTHPMAYQWAIENFPWNLLTQLRDAGCEATDDTGIHVHVSRAGFSSASHIYRWMKLIYRNQPQVTTLARRSSPEYAAFTDDDRRAIKTYAKGACSERHRAVNTSNTDTFELRIFAGSLDRDEVQAALAFTAASVEYTRTLPVAAVAAGGWSWPAFTAWTARHPAYAPLTRQLEVLACAC